jgi:hypothetical protein
MKRRNFLKLTTAGTAAAALAKPSLAWAAPSNQIMLSIEPVSQQMIDGEYVDMMLFYDAADNSRPVLRVLEGQQITVTVTKRLRDHRHCRRHDSIDRSRRHRNQDFHRAGRRHLSLLRPG